MDGIIQFPLWNREVNESTLKEFKTMMMEKNNELMNKCNQLLDKNNELVDKNNQLLDILINREKNKEEGNEKLITTKEAYNSLLGEYLAYIPFIGIYLKNRYEASTLVNFIEGIDLTSDNVDVIVNMFSLVQALLLTISPALMLSLQGDTWSNLQQNILDCNVTGSDDLWYNHIFITIWNSVFASIIAEATGLVFAVQYFFFRPKNDILFTKWWKLGFYGMIIMTICLLITVITILVALSYFLTYLVVPEDQLCTTVQAATDGLPISLGLLQRNAFIIAACIYSFFFVLMAFLFA